MSKVTKSFYLIEGGLSLNEMTLSGLIRAFESQWARESNWVGIVVMLPNGREEVIINNSFNFEDKLEYYKNAYNEDLTLKANTDIKIVDYTFGNSFAELEDTLY